MDIRDRVILMLISAIAPLTMGAFILVATWGDDAPGQMPAGGSIVRESKNPNEIRQICKKGEKRLVFAANALGEVRAVCIP